MEKGHFRISPKIELHRTERKLYLRDSNASVGVYVGHCVEVRLLFSSFDLFLLFANFCTEENRAHELILEGDENRTLDVTFIS
jgi:hypothetical protein